MHLQKPNSYSRAPQFANHQTQIFFKTSFTKKTNTKTWTMQSKTCLFMYIIIIYPCYSPKYICKWLSYFGNVKGKFMSTIAKMNFLKSFKSLLVTLLLVVFLNIYQWCVFHTLPSFATININLYYVLIILLLFLPFSCWSLVYMAYLMSSSTIL